MSYSGVLTSPFLGGEASPISSVLGRNRARNPLFLFEIPTCIISDCLTPLLGTGVAP